MSLLLNAGLAKNTSSRFNSLLPYTDAEEAARLSIAALRKGEEELFIPSFLCPLYRMSKMWPREAQLAVLDYLDINMGTTE